jgi:hypothetical protein
MVRPARFAWNPQTQASNRYQRDDAALAEQAAQLARLEFDELAIRLRAAGVIVHAVDDRIDPACPDAVFPNNWVSSHDDGTLVLYPMLAPNRRLERRQEILDGFAQQGYRVERLLDLTHHEAAGRYLEGTGSIVFDHASRTAYACLSPRTDGDVLHELCAALGYEPCTFRATDLAGTAVYHTNVILAIGTRFVVAALDSIDERDRARVRQRLVDTGRTVVAIDREQVRRFAGNVLELRATDGASVLALSAQAQAAFDDSNAERLRRSVDRIVSAPVPTIETLGGGSVRCMLAEVFLPS